jgi:hypothetical protein
VDDTLPRMQELRERGALTKITIKMSDAIHGRSTGAFLFISHRCTALGLESRSQHSHPTEWAPIRVATGEDPSKPDCEGKQLAAVKEYLRTHPEIKYVWFDYWCMPQRKDKDTEDRSPGELIEFAHMLSCIADLYLTTKVLILLDNSYVGRFWTMMEAWCSMQVSSKMIVGQVLDDG